MFTLLQLGTFGLLTLYLTFMAKTVLNEFSRCAGNY